MQGRVRPSALRRERPLTRQKNTIKVGCIALFPTYRTTPLDRALPGRFSIRNRSPRGTTTEKAKNMVYPSASQFGKALVIAAVIAVAGYLLFPLFGLSEADPQAVFAIALLIGALLGGLLTAVRFEAGPSGAGETGTKTIFVGNLSFKASEEELSQLFAPYGTIKSARVMRHRQSRRPRGFAFVEMPPRQADKAIKALDGKEFLGRQLRVREGNERRPNGEE